MKTYFEMSDDEKKTNGYPDIPTNPVLKEIVERFFSWIKNRNVEFKCSEKKVYSIEHNFCGTLDFLAILDGKYNTLWDLKTSNGIYPEMFLQTTGYKMATLEEYPKFEISHCGILRIGKDGSFEAKELNDYAKNKEAFIGALTLYRRLKEMKHLEYINS